MKKRLIALALLLCMLFSCALAEDARYGQVYDTAQDAGRLTVRYLWCWMRAIRRRRSMSSPRWTRWA